MLGDPGRSGDKALLDTRQTRLLRGFYGHGKSRQNVLFTAPCSGISEPGAAQPAPDLSRQLGCKKVKGFNNSTMFGSCLLQLRATQLLVMRKTQARSPEELQEGWRHCKRNLALKTKPEPRCHRSSPQALAEPRPEEKQMLSKAGVRLQLNKTEIKTPGPPDPAAGDYRLQTGTAHTQQPNPPGAHGSWAGKGESPT